jgi:hypothetical protein
LPDFALKVSCPDSFGGSLVRNDVAISVAEKMLQNTGKLMARSPG